MPKQLNEQITFNLSEKDKERVRQAAEENFQTAAAYCRQAVLESAERDLSDDG